MALDINRIFASLEREAREMAREVEASGAIDRAKKAAGDFHSKLGRDPQTRNIAAGAGGLLLLGLLGSRGGRNMIGGVAKTGAVAALGALAYRAWQNREGGAGGGNDLVAAARANGFPTDLADDPDFALAVLRAMLASAYADGVLDAHEREMINSAIDSADLSADERAMLTNEIPEDRSLALIAAAAKTPRHAEELYAAAVVSAGEIDEKESAFLGRLADRLGLSDAAARSIRDAAKG